MDLFRNRQLVIATKHEKDKVLTPVLSSGLGVITTVPDSFDTDIFGTFSGEVEREGSPIETAKRKVQAALEVTGATLAVASEGSFGPHPSLFFVPSDEEFLFFKDVDNDLEIIVRYLTEETNFSHREITSVSDLQDFCFNVQFPSHGIILRAEKASVGVEIFKEISTLSAMEKQVLSFLRQGYVVRAETDMRAMRNPLRMKAIEQAAIKLVEKIKSQCPKCQSPGFGITEVIPGLPCRLCKSATRSTKAYIYSCVKCDYTEERANVEKPYEDPMYCDFCNP